MVHGLSEYEAHGRLWGAVLLRALVDARTCPDAARWVSTEGVGILQELGATDLARLAARVATDPAALATMRARLLVGRRRSA